MSDTSSGMSKEIKHDEAFVTYCIRVIDVHHVCNTVEDTEKRDEEEVTPADAHEILAERMYCAGK
jgi:hypothetical protein